MCHHTHHDDPDTNAHPSDNVQFGVEHLVDGSRTTLTEAERKGMSTLILKKTGIH